MVSTDSLQEDRRMARRMTKAEASAFRERWRLVNAREEEELRNTSLEVRWRQFNTLLLWAHQFGWTAGLDEGVDEVRQRWAKLRKAYRG
jgi:hypothetical protein